MRGIWMAAALAVAASTAAAQDEVPTGFEAGYAEYLVSCSACHGPFGRGDGPVAQVLRPSVPDIRRLSLENGGVFPFRTVLDVIDGRAPIRAHGNPMPVYGTRFRAEEDAVYGPVVAERLARARLLELAAFLQVIQDAE